LSVANSTGNRKYRFDEIINTNFVEKCFLNGLLVALTDGRDQRRALVLVMLNRRFLPPESCLVMVYEGRPRK
jgi:hypothetical protein